MVDMAAWEQDKENVRPSRTGRDPVKLSQAISQLRSEDQMSGSRSFDEQRQSERRDFEARLSHLSNPNEANSGREIVQLWSEYVHWAAEWFPTDSQEERCLLERATSSLADCLDCRNDLQYLKLWLRLADLLKEPQDIFNFLWVREIGLGHALFYEAWSCSFERQHRFDEAEEVLNVAVARSAQPCARLDASRQALAQRMRNRVLRSAESLETSSQDMMVPRPVQRPTLNFLTAAESHSFHRPVERTCLHGVGGAAASTEISSSSSFGCLDEAFSGEPPRASIFDAQAVWLTAPTKESLASKENAGPRTKTISAATRTRRRNTTRQQPSLNEDVAIFVDEELREPNSPAGCHHRVARNQAEDVVKSRRSVDARMSSAVSSLERTARTPPGMYEQGTVSSGTPIASTFRAPPGAPNRELRRRRVSDPQDTTNDLAAILSGLRLGDQPPPKKARGVSAFQSMARSSRGDASALRPTSEDTTTVVESRTFLCTPPRMRMGSLRAELFGETSGAEPPPAAPSPHCNFLCSRSCLPEPRRLLQGDKSSSSGKSPLHSIACDDLSPSTTTHLGNCRRCSASGSNSVLGGSLLEPLRESRMNLSGMSVFEDVMQPAEASAVEADDGFNIGRIEQLGSVPANGLHSRSQASSRLLVFED
jgi:hypothetical protein